jgi:hypothetical protein
MIRYIVLNNAYNISTIKNLYEIALSVISKTLAIIENMKKQDFLLFVNH